MDILFIDANVMFSAAYRVNAGINRFWQLSSVKLITSLYAVEEVRRNLKQVWQIEHLEKLITNMQLISTTHDDKIIPAYIKLRSKDRPILAAAIIAKAHYLITGDYRDFGIYFHQTIAGVTILPPADYLQKLKS